MDLINEYEDLVKDEFKTCTSDKLYDLHMKHVNIHMFTYRFVMRELLKNMTSDGYCAVEYKGFIDYESINIYSVIINKIVKCEKVNGYQKITFVLETYNKYLCELWYEPYWTDNYLRIIEKTED